MDNEINKSALENFFLNSNIEIDMNRSGVRFPSRAPYFNRKLLSFTTLFR